ncbi:hypothetical protein J4226_05710 [Candidatus Pacearchaeota archaeon]|nr:hypothetical protein [Candidatus Pacearchaeota archaeon]
MKTKVKIIHAKYGVEDAVILHGINYGARLENRKIFKFSPWHSIQTRCLRLQIDNKIIGFGSRENKPLAS